MDSELTASERSQLIEFARSMVDRARQAGAAPAEFEQEPRSLLLHDKLDSKTILDLLSQYRRFFDKTRAQLARELDIVLLTVERLENEITVLRGEVQGLRDERQQLIARVRRTEQDLAAAATEFGRQVSAEVDSIASRLTSYIDDVSEAARAPISRMELRDPAGDKLNKSNSQSYLVSTASGPNGDTQPIQPLPAAGAPASPTSKSRAPGESNPGALIGFLQYCGRKLRSQSAPKTDLIALADRARDRRDWQTAVRLYRKALDRQPDNAPIWVQYGHALKESGNRIEAENAYRKSVELNPKVADTHLQLGHVLKIQEKRGAAAVAYLRAIELDPALKAATTELLALGWTEDRIQNALP
jgi:tetratricopeptide (TPR) repeat protein